MKREPWNLFQLFDSAIKTDSLNIQPFISEYEQDQYYNKVTKQIEIDQRWIEDLTDYIYINPPIIKTLNDHINESLRSEILSVYDNIERVFFSFSNENDRISFIKSVKNKVRYLIMKCKCYNDLHSELFVKYLSLLELNIIERYESEISDGTILSNEKELQRKNPKISINLNRDQLGALIYLLLECDILDNRVKISQLARSIESNILLLDNVHNYTPAKSIEVLLSQMKKDDKDYKKILHEVIDKFKTSPTFVS